MTLPTTDIAERTEILYGTENVINEELRFFSKTKTRIDTCMDHTRPSLAIEIESIKRAFLDAKKRGVELRYLTEIIQQNITPCKKLMQIVDEVRHLDGLKGNFIVSENEYLAPSSPYDNAKPASWLFYSNLKEIVEQHQYLFEVLWNKAIPAQERIREIEEGIEHGETRVLENPDEIFKHIKNVIENASKRLVCSSSGGMQIVYSNFFDLYKKIIDKHRGGEGEGVRWIPI